MIESKAPAQQGTQAKRSVVLRRPRKQLGYYGLDSRWHLCLRIGFEGASKRVSGFKNRSLASPDALGSQAVGTTHKSDSPSNVRMTATSSAAMTKESVDDIK